MEYMYAAMLLHSAGREISENSVESIISAAGITPDGVRVKALVAALADVAALAEVNIEEALKAPIFAAAAGPAAAPAAEDEPAEEEPKEEEKKEEEEDLQGLSALFG